MICFKSIFNSDSISHSLINRNPATIIRVKIRKIFMSKENKRGEIKLKRSNPMMDKELDDITKIEKSLSPSINDKSAIMGSSE